MAGITLAEASKIIETPLKKGIVTTIARESAVLELLPIVGINGNAYSYVQEGTTGTVGFRDVNTDYTHTNPTYVTKTEHLRRLGSKVEVDRFIELTQNIHNVRAEATQAKAKAIANAFTKAFFKGNASSNNLEFDGLDIRIKGEQVIDASQKNLEGVEGQELLNELLDKVMGGADVLFMNKRTRRKVTSMFASQGSYIQQGQDSFGRPCAYFGDVRIAVVDDAFIEDNSIYAVKFGQENGVVGIQAGELQAVDNGLRGTMYETLIEWYVSIIDPNPKGMARLKAPKLTTLAARAKK